MEEVRRNWPFLRDRRIDAYGHPDELVDRLRCAAHGFRMPAEWEPHEAHGSPGRTIARTGPASSRPSRGSIPRSCAQLARRGASAHPGRRSRATGAGAAAASPARARLAGRGILSCTTNRELDARLRPDLRIRTRRAELAITQWRFNGWAKYDNDKFDARVPQRFLARG